MNKRSLGALIALNVVLLAGVVLTSLAPQRAEAQGFQVARASYIMLPGQVIGRNNQAAVYIIELTRGQMVALFYNSNTDELEVIDRRDIADDARAGGGGGR